MTIERLAYSVNDTCELIGGIGRTAFYGLVSRGELRVTKVGARTMVLRTEIERFLAHHLAHHRIDDGGEQKRTRPYRRRQLTPDIA